jgi:hypothetical protein
MFQEYEMATNRWDDGFLHTSIHDVSADTKANGNEPENNPIPDPGLLEPFVVGPWLYITDKRISLMAVCWVVMVLLTLLLIGSF